MTLRKRLIALSMAAACAATAFAGAAFTDQSSIKVDSKVIDTLTEKNVIKGFEDGSFQPDKLVTRAEMAKMIFVLRTNSADATYYANTLNSPLTDINDSWAKGYIKYCQHYGIVCGRSDAKYYPNAPVTTAEAAKMLLLELRYTEYLFTGEDWKAVAMAKADETGLLQGVECGVDAPLTRQYAAQMIYNAHNAE